MDIVFSSLMNLHFKERLDSFFLAPEGRGSKKEHPKSPRSLSEILKKRRMANNLYRAHQNSEVYINELGGEGGVSQRPPTPYTPAPPQLTTCQGFLRGERALLGAQAVHGSPMNAGEDIIREGQRQ